ncbi:MAG: glutathione S-transferase family protein [Halieaceae bacterium]|jgi:glutathione S-transferase|nr:glutathione S-transferase family protein [Halieaceae bacterium]
MHLYTYESAPNPRRLHLFQQYKQIELPTDTIDMRAGAHREAAFLEINPLGTLPALLTDEGVLLTEVVGICVYLEEHYPERPLMGRSALERALVLSWDHRIFFTVFEPFAEILRNRSPAFAHRALPGPIDVEQIPELVDRGRHRYGAGLRQIDSELGDSRFLCGDSISLADISLLVGIETGSWVKESLPEECERLQRWMQRCHDVLG